MDHNVQTSTDTRKGLCAYLWISIHYHRLWHCSYKGSRSPGKIKGKTIVSLMSISAFRVVKNHTMPTWQWVFCYSCELELFATSTTRINFLLLIVTLNQGYIFICSCNHSKRSTSANNLSDWWISLPLFDSIFFCELTDSTFSIWSAADLITSIWEGKPYSLVAYSLD